MPAIYQIFQGAPNKKTKAYFRNKQKNSQQTAAGYFYAQNFAHLQKSS